MSYAARISFLLLLLSVSLYTYSNGLEPEPGVPVFRNPKGNAEKPPASDKQTQGKKPATSHERIERKPNCDCGKYESRQKADPVWWKDTNVWIAFFTLIAAIGAVGAAIATSKAVGATRDGINLARKSQIEIERAYLLMKIPRVRKTAGEGGDSYVLSVQPLIMNAGKTPAFNINYRVTVRWFPGTNLPEPPDYDSIPPNTPDMPLSAGAKLWIDRKGGVVLQYPERQQIIASGAIPHLYCYGIIGYDDIFGEPRTTTFCWIISAAGESSARHGGRAYNDWT